MAAKLYGLKTVFTEHSLFGFHDAAGINLNKLLKWAVRDLDAAICVSNACKDNFCLRTKFNPNSCFTIPNAVDSLRFYPDLNKKKTSTINVVYVSRLMYRKGVDLLIGLIPLIISQFSHVNFIIGGDGDKMPAIRSLIDKLELHDRVELLGSLEHGQVRDVLCRGDIFLNTSLTESFCIAILEAACCGLLVVTTDVGGVPEVLPPEMAFLAKPTVEALHG
jgi:phosphatidylinositol glycan class A protein